MDSVYLSSCRCRTGIKGRIFYTDLFWVEDNYSMVFITFIVYDNKNWDMLIFLLHFSLKTAKSWQIDEKIVWFVWNIFLTYCIIHKNWNGIVKRGGSEQHAWLLRNSVTDASLKHIFSIFAILFNWSLELRFHSSRLILTAAEIKVIAPLATKVELLCCMKW